MDQKKRIVLAVLILVGLVAVVMGLDAWRGYTAAKSIDVSVDPGDVPVYFDEELIAAFNADDLNDLQEASFVDDEEGKTQEGWLLGDILGKYAETDSWSDTVEIIVSSSSRNKSVSLTWAEVKAPENKVLFDLSGRGTLKLVSRLEKLDIRDEWIQDVDSIEVITR